MVLGSVQDLDDEGRVYERTWQLPKDCQVLAERIKADGLGLVTVDGLGYAIAGDSHNYAVVGSALAGLAKVAERTGCAIRGLTHPPKGSSDPTTAAIGSTAWTAIPRVVIVLGRDPDDDDRRVVRVSKTNFVDPGHGWAWSIAGDETTEAGYVTSVARSDVATETLTAGPESGEERTAQGEAVDWLRDHLYGGERPAGDILPAAKKAGHSERTLRRAKAALHVASVKAAFGDGWVWRLPDTQGCHEGSLPAPANSVGSLGNSPAELPVSAQTGPPGHEGCHDQVSGNLGNLGDDSQEVDGHEEVGS
ncbi:MAG: AAA family ATPase [Acidimicrobiales bacterium]